MQTLETVNLFFQDIQLTVYYEYGSIALTQIYFYSRMASLPNSN